MLQWVPVSERQRQNQESMKTAADFSDCSPFSDDVGLKQRWQPTPVNPHILF